MIEKKFINDLFLLKNSRIIFNLKAMLNVVKKNVAVGKLNYKFKNGFMIVKNVVNNADGENKIFFGFDFFFVSKKLKLLVLLNLKLLQLFMEELFNSTKESFIEIMGNNYFQISFDNIKIDESQLIDGVRCLSKCLVIDDNSVSVKKMQIMLLKHFQGIFLLFLLLFLKNFFLKLIV